MKCSTLVAGIAVALLSVPGFSQTMTVAAPERVGLTSTGLRSIGEVVQRHIDAKGIPGAVVLVARNGRIAYLEAQGDATPGKPLQKDTVFWVASMTKPIVVTAVMMMVDAGKVSLDDPVSKFVPEFATPRQVRVVKPGAIAPKLEYDLVPAERPILVRHLLTHTSGLQSIGVPNDSLAPIEVGDTLATHVPRLAGATLEFQPGSRWAYSNATGFDVLARIVEVASGQTFYDFAQRRIFAPLGMVSASFGPRAELAARTMEVAPPLAANPCVNGKTYACGSAGLWMSADDYARFAQMLLNGGEFAGKQLLSRRAVAAMSANQSGALFPGSSGVPGADKGVGFGLGMVIVEDSAASGLAIPTGSFGWDGVGTRRFWVIPRERMVIVMLVPSGAAAPVHREIERSAMAAIVRR